MNKLNKLKKKSLSSQEVLNLVKGKANLLKYSELMDYNNIEEALKPYGALILLYETKFNYGHWCAVIKRGPKRIEHFDSYGLMPDDELKFVSKYMRKILDQDLPHLTALLYKSGYTIEYNHFHLQEKKKGINTCGRWVASRILLKHIPIERFFELFNDIYLKPDDLVTIYTEILL